MGRLFIELSDREDEVAQVYGGGLEVKEIANLFFKSVATIRNQLQSIYLKLNVRNRSELSIKLMERRFDVKFSMNFSQPMRSVIACILLCVFFLSLYREQGDMRRSRRTRVETIERARRL